MNRPKIGSVIEFKTAKGLAYGQVTHKHPEYSYLIRVFFGFHDSRPDSFEGAVSEPVRFSAFTHLPSAIKQNCCSTVAELPVREELRPFTLFRAGMYDFVTKQMGPWWLWDGEKEWRVGNLTPEQLKYPKLGVWNAALIVERIESDWVEEGCLW